MNYRWIILILSISLTACGFFHESFVMEPARLKISMLKGWGVQNAERYPQILAVIENQTRYLFVNEDMLKEGVVSSVSIDLVEYPKVELNVRQIATLKLKSLVDTNQLTVIEEGGCPSLVVSSEASCFAAKKTLGGLEVFAYIYYFEHADMLVNITAAYSNDESRLSVIEILGTVTESL